MELKNTIAELKILLEVFKIRFEQAGERISKHEERSFEIIKFEA